MILTLPSGATDPVVPGLYNHPLPCFQLGCSPALLISLLTASAHRFIGLPLRLVPKGCARILSLPVVPLPFFECAHTTGRHWSLNNVDSDASWYNVHSSSFLLILHCPPSFTGPNILLNTFRSNISNMSADFWLRTQVSLPSETTCLMRDLYILSLEDYERLRLLKRLLMAK